ncbi:E3 ubiquitin-protein ligase [Fusarium oxysporum f. sp. albedinis]|nr:E3 ubiquitin-protein ligase [Fusarium oxysporum f. sp. albedinis]
MKEPVISSRLLTYYELITCTVKSVTDSCRHLAVNRQLDPDGATRVSVVCLGCLFGPLIVYHLRVLHSHTSTQHFLILFSLILDTHFAFITYTKSYRNGTWISEFFLSSP